MYRGGVKLAVITPLAVLSITSAGLVACSSADSPPGTTGSGGSSTGATVSASASTGETSSSSSAAGGGSATSTTGAGGGTGAACTAKMFGDNRPVALHVPQSYSCDKGAPLVIMLHGYTVSSAIEEVYLNITAESEKRGFLYAHPDGTKDAQDKPFWNATDVCCDFGGTMVDDSAYLSKLIKDVEAAYNVDAKRVYLIGHSNGGFMSYRMACDHGDQIAGIASLAGAMFNDVTKCAAQTPVSVLEIHGTADMTIAYKGGKIGANTFPAATTSVADWATIDACLPQPDTSGAPMDLDTGLVGDETLVSNYTGCKSGTGVSLWTIEGGSHIPSFGAAFIPDVMDFLYAHPKP